MFTIDSATDYAATYAAATVGEKNRMRTAIGDAIDAAVRSGDFASATALVAIRDTFGPAAKSTPAVDYVGLFADMRATYAAAIARIDAGDVVVPDGVTVPDMSDLSSGVADDARVTALVTVTGRKSGKGRVVPFIVAALATSDGPMSASDIHNAWTAVGASDDYPTEGPSVGAIGAAFARRMDTDRDDTDDYGFDVTTNAAGTRVAVLSA